MRLMLSICKKRKHVIESIRSKIDSIFPGENPSEGYGLGVDIENFREYTFGDDFRKIDWKISSRQPYISYPKFMIREYREEKALHLLCLLDASESMAFKRKWEIAIITLLTLIELARRRKDVVGVVAASGKDTILNTGFIRSKGLSDYILRIICRGELRPHGIVDLKYVTRALSRNLNRRTMIIFITDLAHDIDDLNYFISVLINKGHSIGMFFTLEEYELSIPSAGLMTIEDMERDDTVTLLDKFEVEFTNRLLKEHFDKVASLLRLYRVPFVILTSINDIIRNISAFIEMYRVIKVRAYV